MSINRIPPISDIYSRFIGLVKKAAKNNIPRGHRKSYIPGWNEENQLLYERFRETGDIQTGKKLLSGLDKKRKEDWDIKMQNMSFAKSSKNTWSLLHRLAAAQRHIEKLPTNRGSVTRLHRSIVSHELTRKSTQTAQKQRHQRVHSESTKQSNQFIICNTVHNGRY